MPATNDYLDFLLGQRQTREFTSEPVSESDIHALLEAMRWTGSSSNEQPWQFLVLRDSATIEALAPATEHTDWIAYAPLLLVVLTAGSDPNEHLYDLGRIDQRILLAAEALGLGAGIITFWNDESQLLARNTLELPEDWSIYSAVAVGHPSDHSKSTRPGKRKPLAELVHWDHF